MIKFVSRSMHFYYNKYFDEELPGWKLKRQIAVHNAMARTDLIEKIKDLEKGLEGVGKLEFSNVETFG